MVGKYFAHWASSSTLATLDEMEKNLLFPYRILGYYNFIYLFLPR